MRENNTAFVGSFTLLGWIIVFISVTLFDFFKKRVDTALKTIAKIELERVGFVIMTCLYEMWPCGSPQRMRSKVSNRPVIPDHRVKYFVY